MRIYQNLKKEKNFMQIKTLKKNLKKCEPDIGDKTYLIIILQKTFLLLSIYYICVAAYYSYWTILNLTIIQRMPRTNCLFLN